MRKKRCKWCKRVIPVRKGRFVRHNIQSKGWYNSDNGKDLCDASNIRVEHVDTTSISASTIC